MTERRNNYIGQPIVLGRPPVGSPLHESLSWQQPAKLLASAESSESPQPEIAQETGARDIGDFAETHIGGGLVA